MMAVKRPDHSIVKRTRLKVAGKHARPGDRLQQRPMRGESNHKRKNYQDFAES